MFARERRTTWIAALIGALALAACEVRGPSDPWTLRRGLRLAKTVEIGVQQGAARQAAVRAAKRLRSTGEREVELVRPGKKPDEDALRVLIGDASTPGMALALERLGVELTANGFAFLGRSYEREDDALVATLEDPEAAGRPLTVFFAAREGRIAPYVRDLTLAARRGFRVYRDGALARQGVFADDGSWVKERTLEFEDERAQLFAHPVTIERTGFALVLPEDASRELDPYLMALKRARESVLDVFAPSGSLVRDGVASEIPKVRVRAYLHAEDKLRCTGDDELASVNPVTGEVEVVLAPGLADDAGFGLARSLAVALAGAPASEWMLDGVAAYAVPRWWGTDKDEWLAHLVAGELVPSIELLLDSNAGLSPHLVVPLRGALFRHLIKTLGADGLLAVWRGDKKLELDQRLREDFLQRLAAIRARNAERLADTRGERASAARGRPLLHGIDLCAPWEPEHAARAGFGTRACRASLERAHELGADAVALVFHAFQMREAPDFAGDAAAAPLERDASDLVLAATLADARALGMTCMLRPQILASRSGQWGGWLLSESPRVAAHYFADQERLLVHCGLLAELCGVEILCIGGEAPSASVTLHSPEEEPWVPAHLAHNLELWHASVTAVRGAFRGALTYAASLANEAQGIEFWPELDFVGVDLYGSLSSPPFSDERPDDETALGMLGSELHETAELARAAGRPALLTEVGFSATSASWRAPFETRGTTDPAEQARLYALLARALARPGGDKSEIAGLFLWSWSTDPDAGADVDGRADPRAARGFSPQGKPAERELARLFQ